MSTSDYVLTTDNSCESNDTVILHHAKNKNSLLFNTEFNLKNDETILENDNQVIVNANRNDDCSCSTDSEKCDFVNTENMAESDNQIIICDNEVKKNFLFDSKSLSGVPNNKNKPQSSDQIILNNTENECQCDSQVMANDTKNDENSCNADSGISSNTSPVVLYLREDNVNEEDSVTVLQKKSLPKNNEERPFSCEICDKTFKRRSHLNIHLHTHKTEKPYVCKTCSKAFTHHYFLQRHEVIHNSVKQFSCEYCHEEFSVRRYYTRHVRRHMKKRYECDACDTVCYKLTESINHIKSHGSGYFSCDKCDRCFCEELSLNLHHCFETDAKRFACTNCPKKFRKISDLNDHIAVHENKKSFICDICKDGFNTKTHLYVHKQMKHVENNEDKPHSCRVCEKKFHSQFNLKRHERRHENKTSVNKKTNPPPKESDSNEDSQDARKTCVNQKPAGLTVGYINIESPVPVQLPVYFVPGKKINYVCEICLKGFRHRHALRTHYRRHMGVKPFQCDICNWRFADKTDLKRHSYTHSKDHRKYTCEYCGSTFTRKFNLTIHLRTSCVSRNVMPKITSVFSVKKEEST